MPRQATQPFAAPLLASLALAAALVVSPALAAVNFSGDIKPAAPGGFGVPTGAIDNDADGINDFIDGSGNQVLTFLADPTNPAGGNGLPWNDPLIWADYETTQNILVGENGFGFLEINGASALRYQNLVLGGASDSNAGLLQLTTTGQDDYNADFLTDIQTVPLGSRTGFGVVNVTGVGSVFNNAPNIIPGEFQTALNIFDDPSGGSIGTLVTTTPDRTLRADDIGFDVHVGLLSGGQLNVTAGGRVEIQDALLVGSASTAQGDVTVDGLGSYLAAYGRTNFEAGGGGGGTTQDPGGAFASYIGGNGRGSLTISDGARAEFFSGLSIGASNDDIGALSSFDISNDPQSSGVVTVMGNGSTLTVAPRTGPVGLVNNATLAIGELREDPAITQRYDTSGDLIDAPDGTETLGDGLLRIETGSQVIVSGTGSTEVGFNGVVELRGGVLNTGGDIVNDGRIDGVGRITGRTLDTSVYSIIRGGDPEAEPTSPSAEPLRVVLNGEVGGGDDFPNPTFTNRGSVEGLVDMRVTGDITNGVSEGAGDSFAGRIEAGGQITARKLFNATGSTLVGNSATGSPLQIRLDSGDQVNEGIVDPATGASSLGALQNYGLIAGNIDIVTPGGVVNGAEHTSVASVGRADPDGGTIRANGTIQAGTFINHRFGLIQVSPGERLTIQTVIPNPIDTAMGTPSGVLQGIVVGDGVDATLPPANPGGPDGEIDTDSFFTAANLGTIIVDGGTFEASWLEEERDAVADGNIDYFRLFRNARQVIVDTNSTTAIPLLDGAVGETVGTIVSTDGTLDFGQGMVNTGVVAFDGGSNTVRGRIYNAGFFRPGNDGPDMLPGTLDDVPARNGIDYDTSTEEFLRPGVIVVSGDGTSVTFTDAVNNTGIISIGPDENVVNFLGDLDNTGGTIQVALSPFATESVSAFITVGGEVRINGGSLVLNGGAGPVDPTNPSLATAPGSLALATAPEEFSLTVIDSDGPLAEGSLFTNLVFPETPDGVFFDVIYDEVNGEVRVELVVSDAIGADFNNDNIVDQSDLEIWNRNVGITSGASIVQGDANFDGRVDLGDYELIQQQIFSGGTPIAFSVAVPEPAAMMLLCLAGVGFAASRRS